MLTVKNYIDNLSEEARNGLRGSRNSMARRGSSRVRGRLQSWRPIRRNKRDWVAPRGRHSNHHPHGIQSLVGVPAHLGRSARWRQRTPILDSILRATDDALNANPLRQVIPVDWAEIARALRTVWLRSD